MKHSIMLFVMFSVKAALVPEDEKYVTDESINDSSDNTTPAIERYMSFSRKLKKIS